MTISNFFVIRLSLKTPHPEFGWNFVPLEGKDREEWFKIRVELFKDCYRALKSQSHPISGIFLLLHTDDVKLYEKYCGFLHNDDSFIPLFLDASDNSYGEQKIYDQIHAWGYSENVALCKVDSDDILSKTYTENMNLHYLSRCENNDYLGQNKVWIMSRDLCITDKRTYAIHLHRVFSHYISNSPNTSDYDLYRVLRQCVCFTYNVYMKKFLSPVNIYAQTHGTLDNANLVLYGTDSRCYDASSLLIVHDKNNADYSDMKLLLDLGSKSDTDITSIDSLEYDKYDLRSDFWTKPYYWQQS